MSFRSVKCDEVLAKAIRGVSSRDELILSSEEVLKSILARMLDTSALPPPKVQRPDLNKLAPIDIQVANRSGGKKVRQATEIFNFGFLCMPARGGVDALAAVVGCRTYC